MLRQVLASKARHINCIQISAILNQQFENFIGNEGLL